MDKFKEFTENYFEILNTDLKGLNLTALKSVEEIYQKQVLDCLLAIENIPKLKETLGGCENIVDIGFGGGFPLLIYSILFPEKKIIGIESKNKKVEAIRLIAKKLNLNNVKVVHARFEELLIDKFSVVNFKAVGEVSELLPKLNLQNENSKVVFYKGPLFIEQESKWKSKDWSLEFLEYYQLPAGDQRCVACYKNVPRGTNDNYLKLKEKSLNSLVKLSSII